MLEEDSKVNRLVSRLHVFSSGTDLTFLHVVQEDSITLWREICGNALLEGATLILFFNKVTRSVEIYSADVLTIFGRVDGYPPSDAGCRYTGAEVRPKLR